MFNIGKNVVVTRVTIGRQKINNLNANHTATRNKK